MTSRSASALQDEIRQLKRTLEIRKSEISLTEKRVRDLEGLSKSMKEASDSALEKTAQLGELDASLQIEVERGHSLQQELKELQEAIAAEDAARTRHRSTQLKFMSTLLNLANEMTAVTESAANDEPSRPQRIIDDLTEMSDEVTTMFDRAVNEYNDVSAEHTRVVDRLRDTHAACIEEIRQAAEDNDLQRHDLEEAWRVEEEALQKELRAVKQRAREAAFHHHRGSGVKCLNKTEDRLSITERRQVHQECVTLEKAIAATEAEREKERIRTMERRAALLKRN